MPVSPVLLETILYCDIQVLVPDPGSSKPRLQSISPVPLPTGIPTSHGPQNDYVLYIYIYMLYIYIIYIIYIYTYIYIYI